MKIERALDLAQRCRDAAAKKTLYVFGAFGAPLNAKNKERALDAYAYNRGAARAKKIQAATADTFGFDCSGLIKGLLWGWQGDENSPYGGAEFKANGVPDQNADTIIRKCSQVSEDFSDLRVGEAVWMPGHIGIYVGDGLAAEASPKWADGVQLTACNCRKAGYHTRTWKKHGRLPYVSYEEQTAVLLQVLCRGSSGEAVKALQRLLRAMGYAIGNKNPIDGSFGPKVEQAVRNFQREQGLPVTGWVEQATWEKLLGV